VEDIVQLMRSDGWKTLKRQAAAGFAGGIESHVCMNQTAHDLLVRVSGSSLTIARHPARRRSELGSKMHAAALSSSEMAA
jgi:hypothetical protein